MGAVTIPVIASSGAGAVEHFSEVFEATGVQAVGQPTGVDTYLCCLLLEEVVGAVVHLLLLRFEQKNKGNA